MGFLVQKRDLMKLSRIPKTVILLASLALLVVVPWIASDYFVMMCIRVMYFGMLTLSLCFLAGELGVVSLMQASFFGIEASEHRDMEDTTELRVQFDPAARGDLNAFLDTPVRASSGALVPLRDVVNPIETPGMDRIYHRDGYRTSTVRASFTPPALPRPPACTCALTTQSSPPSCCAALTAASGVSAATPRGTGIPKSANNPFD